jgi:glycosyltransferase involved in cell wall biosynthesis
MRILFLNPIGNVGGAERVLLAAVAGVKRELPATVVRVLALSDGPLVAAARELGAEADALPLPADLGELGDSPARGAKSLVWRSVARLPALASFVGRLRAAVTRFAPTLVHSNGIKTHLLSRCAVPAGVPVVWHVHDFYGSRPAAGWLLRRARSRVRAGIAVSRAVAADARRVLPGVRVDVVPNAVDLDHFSPGRGNGDDLDRRAGLLPAPAGTVRVGLVATYARWKGHLAVLDAAAKLAREAPALPVRWYVVGGPIYHTAAQFTEAELRAAAEARGLAGRVGFVPFAADPAPVYRALDVVLHASTQPEPFGLTVAEAMACGRAVVVSAAGDWSRIPSCV